MVGTFWLTFKNKTIDDDGFTLMCLYSAGRRRGAYILGGGLYSKGKTLHFAIC